MTGRLRANREERECFRSNSTPPLSASRGSSVTLRQNVWRCLSSRVSLLVVARTRGGRETVKSGLRKENVCIKPKEEGAGGAGGVLKWIWKTKRGGCGEWLFSGRESGVVNSRVEKMHRVGRSAEDALTVRA
ncbi:hypothetical protein E2C01_036407 [Portunus trituberculatus]|uniref:Uncharacterized protein n=1 Tax=Portunus trituberculatus TaxID=210409 RepID=A0A5B7FBU3_PORTR|nr:hypothetical protein [Portunus trituberculatus]